MLSTRLLLLLFLLSNFEVESYNYIIKHNILNRRYPVSYTCCASQSEVPLNEYNLLDCGGGKRLEKFGPIIVSRACPSAIWPQGLSRQEWSLAKLSFDVTRTSIDKKPAQLGQWAGLDSLPDDWHVRFEAPGISFNLAASENGQV